MERETQEMLALWLPMWAIATLIMLVLHLAVAPRHRTRKAYGLLILSLASGIAAAVYLVWFFTE
jgi:hypothetical protein